MDIGRLDGLSDDGAVLVVRHPGTGEPTDMRIRLAGSDSKAWRGIVSKTRRRAMQSARDSNSTPAELAAQIEEAKPAILAGVTLDWENVEENGRPVEFTRASARKLYARYSWLAEQVTAFVENRANFFRPEGRGDDEDSDGRGAGADAASPPAEGIQGQRNSPGAP